MAREKVSSAPAQPKKYPGFTDGGKLFWSETPVTNAITNWVRHMISRITREYLSPADVIWSLTSEPKYIQECFNRHEIASWSSLEKFWQWPSAHCGRSFARCLKDFGRGYPVWLSNEREWTRMCDDAEKLHGGPSRFEGMEPGSTDAVVALLAEKLS
jgi:hypothetical protein